MINYPIIVFVAYIIGNIQCDIIYCNNFYIIYIMSYSCFSYICMHG